MSNFFVNSMNFEFYFKNELYQQYNPTMKWTEETSPLIFILGT